MFKQLSLANLRSTTFILFGCHRSIDKSIDFYFFLLSWKSSYNEEFSRWNSKPSHEYKITTHLIDLKTIFIEVRFQQISMTKFFRITEKPYFGVIFAQRKFFLKTLAKYNCSGPPIIQMWKIESRLGWSSNQRLFHHYQHAKIIQSICSIHQIICEIHLI